MGNDFISNQYDGEHKRALPAINETATATYVSGQVVNQTVVLKAGAQFVSNVGFSALVIAVSGTVQLTATKGSNPTYIDMQVVLGTTISDTVDSFQITNNGLTTVSLQLTYTVAISGSTPIPGIVTSVNGQTGAVTLNATNLPGLATVAKTGAYADLSGKPVLAAVAFSGSYNDLSNLPTIPAAQVNSDWNATSGIAQILNKPTTFNPPVATTTVLGGVKQGTNITIAGDGTISAVTASRTSQTAVATSNGQSVFTFATALPAGQTDAYLIGTYLDYGVDYTSSGVTVTLDPSVASKVVIGDQLIVNFTSSVPIADAIQATVLAAPGGAALVGTSEGPSVQQTLDTLNSQLNKALTVTVVAATSAGQSVFPIPGGYPINLITVDLLGTTLINGIDYSGTDGENITLSSAVASRVNVGNNLVVNAFGTFNVASAAQLSQLGATSGATLIGYGSETVKQALDSVVNQVPLGDYTALRAFTGTAHNVQVTGPLGTTTPTGVAGLFVYDPTDTTTADDSGTVIVDSSNRRWKRQFTGAAHVDWFVSLVTGSGATEDWTAAIQQVLNGYTAVHFPYRALGYRVTAPVNLKSGHRISGSGRPLIFRDDQNNHIFSLVSLTNVIIEGLSFSHSYNMAGNRGTFSCIYSLQTGQVKVTNCEFNNTGLYAISTDVSGDGWVITENRFYNIAGTAYDARGGKGHIVANNYIFNTGDDAIDVANTPGAGSSRTIIDNNVIINPGQIQVGGGGIRTNSAGAVITNNQFENANMFFVCVAALSTDGTIKPDRVIIANNVGYGIKPTNNNTTGCVMVKNAGTVKIHDNDFDPVGNGVLTITNVVDNGSAQCRFTVTAHGYTTGNVVRTNGVVGVTGANGTGTVTVIDANTFDITTFAFIGSYTSGGQVWNAIVGIRAYSGDNTPTQNVMVEAHHNRFTRVEAPYRIMLLGLQTLYFNDNIVDTYYSAAQLFDTSTTNRMQLNRNKWLNCAGTVGIFDGNGAGLVTFTDLEMNDNEITLAPGNVNTNVLPFNFNLATVTRAEARRNRLNGLGGRSAPTNIQQFNLANNVALFLFDGDFSGVRYNQGTGTIAQGATTSSAINHACALIDGQAQQPKTLELQVNVALGATTAALVQATRIYSTTFVVATNTAAPSGGLAFVWRLEPATQRYVNGTLAS